MCGFFVIFIYFFLFSVHVVFGAVVSGTQFVTQIENQKVDTKSHPYADIRINNCGELVLKSKNAHLCVTHNICIVFHC